MVSIDLRLVYTYRLDLGAGKLVAVAFDGTNRMVPNVKRALDALGDPTRRRVFRRLRPGTRSVREIADGMDVSRPAVSQHLKILKAAGLVVVRAEGRTATVRGRRPRHRSATRLARQIMG